MATAVSLQRKIDEKEEELRICEADLSAMIAEDTEKRRELINQTKLYLKFNINENGFVERCNEEFAQRAEHMRSTVVMRETIKRLRVELEELKEKRA